MPSVSLSLPFKVATWEESTVHQIDSDSKVTQATVSFAVTQSEPPASSPLTAPSLAVQYVMAYASAAYAEYVGFIRLSGQWSGAAASVVLKEVGTYKKGTGTASELTVVEGSGRGAWQGVSGKGTAQAGHAGGLIQLQLQLAA
jgi:hypothetical protein